MAIIKVSDEFVKSCGYGMELIVDFFDIIEEIDYDQCLKIRTYKVEKEGIPSDNTQILVEFTRDINDDVFISWVGTMDYWNKINETFYENPNHSQTNR